MIHDPIWNVMRNAIWPVRLPAFSDVCTLVVLPNVAGVVTSVAGGAKFSRSKMFVKADLEPAADPAPHAEACGILIQNKAIEKWNGILPQVTGGSMPLLDLNSFKGAKP